MISKQIRIAQIMGKMNSGGVESVVMNYYRNIDKSKVQFDFIVEDDSNNIPYDEIEALGGRVILIPPLKKTFKYIKKIKQIFRKNKYQIVHSHINTLSVFPLYAAKRVGVPIRIAHSHSTTNKKEWKKNLLKNILKPISKINATDYFCCGELAGRWLFGDKIYDEGRVTLLNNAIDITKFEYDEKIRNKFRKKLGLSNNNLLIGHVGRFAEQKNHLFLIDIFYEILKENKSAKLLLIGEGPLLDKVKSKIFDLKIQENIIFLGVVPNVNEYMQAMDVFLLPSLYEGLPVVGIESQAAGLLCIYSDEMTKEVKILESTRFISLDKNAKEWAEHIISDAKTYKRKNTAKNLIESGYEIKTEAVKLENKYKNIILQR